MGKNKKRFFSTSFMQGGKPIATTQQIFDLYEDGSLAIRNLRGDAQSVGEWFLANGNKCIEIHSSSINLKKKYISYKSESEQILYTYGSALIPEPNQGNISELFSLNDNPKEPLNSRLENLYPNLKRIPSRVHKQFFSLFKKGSKVLEMGVAYGNYSEVLLGNLNPASLHLLDCWEEIHGVSDQYKQENLDDAYEQAQSRFNGKSNVFFLKGLTDEILPQSEEKEFDVIYIDADHTFSGCYRDLLLAENYIAKDGFICGHDYTNIANNKDREVNRGSYGVVEAVDKFCLERNWEMIALTIEVENWCFPSYVLKRKK